MKIEIWQSGAGNWFWHLRASNGRIVADAESFPSKTHAVRAARGMVRGVLTAASAFFPLVELPAPSAALKSSRKRHRG